MYENSYLPSHIHSRPDLFIDNLHTVGGRAKGGVKCGGRAQAGDRNTQNDHRARRSTAAGVYKGQLWPFKSIPLASFYIWITRRD